MRLTDEEFTTTELSRNDIRRIAVNRVYRLCPKRTITAIIFAAITVVAVILGLAFMIGEANTYSYTTPDGQLIESHRPLRIDGAKLKYGTYERTENWVVTGGTLAGILIPATTSLILFLALPWDNKATDALSEAWGYKFTKVDQ